MAMEQLPVLFARRGRSGAVNVGVVGDLVSESSCLKVSRDKTSRFRQHRTRPCKKRKDGAPAVLLVLAKSGLGHPPDFVNK